VTNILPEIEKFLSRNSIAASTFGRRACNDGRLVGDMRNGRELSAEMAERLLQMMADWHKPRELPEDFSTNYLTMSNTLLSRHYCASLRLVRDWEAMLPLETRQARVTAQRDQNRESARQAYVPGSWKSNMPLANPDKEAPEARAAQTFLARKGYCPVVSATVYSPKMKGLWIVGRAKMQTDEMMALATKLGWGT